MATFSNYTNINDVPWYRQETIATVFVLVGACVFPPLLYAICFICLTGDIYKSKTKKDGTLRTWSPANKVAAVIILIIQTAFILWRLGIFSLVAS